ncbi:MAG: acetyltransferase [Fuerstiella sp.]
MNEIVIFGTKNFAEIAQYYFTHDSNLTVAGFTVDGDYLEEESYLGLPVVPFEDLAKHFPPERYGIFVALGLNRVNQSRADKVAAAEAKGYRLAGFLSSKAHVADDFVLRPNTMVMEHAILHPRVTVGCDTIIWSTARIAWHSQIGNHCWVTSPCTGERVSVGDNTFLGINCTIAPGVSIGRRNIIGTGALIMSDTKDDEVYRGPVSRAARAASHQLKTF